MSDLPFPHAPRIDACDKVRGSTLFSADHAQPNILHAALAVAAVGKGRITTLDIRASSNVPGLRLILNHQNLGSVKSAGFLMAGGYAFQSLQPMLSPVIAYRGQPIALVVGDRLEVAIEAAALIRATYLTETITVKLDAPEAQTLKSIFPETIAGDADKAFAGAPVKIDARFTTAPQHHNPIELIATVAGWKDGKLTVHEGTQ